MLYIIFICANMLLCVVQAPPAPEPAHICIIGSGIAGASATHFLRERYCLPKSQEGSYCPLRKCIISVFEEHAVVGGRIASVTLDDQGDVTGEAGASIIHSRNKLMVGFRDFLGLQSAADEVDEDSIGLYDGNGLVWKTQGSVFDPIFFLWRYKMSLVHMRGLVTELLSKFDWLYDGLEDGFDTVDSFMERTNGLYNLTQKQFSEVLDGLLSETLINELVMAIMRVNYGQDVGQMNGFSGAVSLAGSGGDLWKVRGGNILIPKGLLDAAEAQVHLNARVSRITRHDESDASRGYDLHFDDQRQAIHCDGAIIAAPLELANIEVSKSWFAPIPKRTFQVTVATFVQGQLCPEYFQERSDCDSCLPGSIFTMSNDSLQFSSISLYRRSSKASFYKIFSRQRLMEATLQAMFKPGFKIVKTFDWFAYPKFSAPEQFAPFRVDSAPNGRLFYCNTIESAASALEMSALAGQNVAALIAKALGLSSRCHDNKHQAQASDKQEL